MPSRPRAQGGDPNPMAVRGRRDPDLAAAMAAGTAPTPDGEDFLSDETEGGPGEVTVDVIAGDVIACKIVSQIDTPDGQSAWVTYGLQTQVQVGESEEEAATRAITVVATRFEDAAAALGDSVANVRRTWSARRITR